MSIYSIATWLTTSKFKSITAANTDNKGHMFVTVFANCAQYHDKSVEPYSVT